MIDTYIVRVHEHELLRFRAGGLAQRPPMDVYIERGDERPFGLLKGRCELPNCPAPRSVRRRLIRPADISDSNSSREVTP